MAEGGIEMVGWSGCKRLSEVHVPPVGQSVVQTHRSGSRFSISLLAWVGSCAAMKVAASRRITHRAGHAPTDMAAHRHVNISLLVTRRVLNMNSDLSRKNCP